MGERCAVAASCWLLVPAAVALLVFNVALTARARGGGTRRSFAAAELASSDALVLLASSVALLEARFAVWQRLDLSTLLPRWPSAWLSFAGLDTSAVAVLAWPGASALGIALAAVLALARRAARQSGPLALSPVDPPMHSPSAAAGDELASPLCAAAWVVVPLPALVHVWHAYGSLGLVALIVLSKIGDIAGYYVGSAIGRGHPFPRISPGKTVEGCLASLVARDAGRAPCCVLLRLAAGRAASASSAGPGRGRADQPRGAGAATCSRAGSSAARA